MVTNKSSQMKLFYLFLLGLVKTGFALMCFECEFNRIQATRSNRSRPECLDPGNNFLKRCKAGERYCRTIFSRIDISNKNKKKVFSNLGTYVFPEYIGISQIFRACSRSKESGKCSRTGFFTTTVCRQTCTADRCNFGNLTQIMDDDDNHAASPHLHFAFFLITIPIMLLLTNKPALY